jgi:hypothetical protein
MTLLLWSLVVVEGKTRRSGENSGRARLQRQGLIKRPAQPLKITAKDREENNDKIRRNLLTVWECCPCSSKEGTGYKCSFWRGV